MDWLSTESLSMLGGAAGTTFVLLAKYGGAHLLRALGRWIESRAQRDVTEAETERIHAKTLQDALAELEEIRERLEVLEGERRSALTERDLALGEMRVAYARRDDALREAAQWQAKAEEWEARGRLAIAQRDKLLQDTTSGHTTPGFVPEWFDKADTIPPAGG